MEEASTNGVHAEWYQEERKQLEAVAVEGNYVSGSEAIHQSPSGQYRLIVREYDSPEASHLGAGGVSRGTVHCGETLLTTVTRDDDHFFFAWIEDHPNGHDYLLCSEHYQGQTVIELDTGRRCDYTPKKLSNDEALISVGYYPSPDDFYIIVEACYWGWPWGLVLYDFRDPLHLPWPIIRPFWEAHPIGWVNSGFRYAIDNTEHLLSLQS
jgi:hypothetical protein